MNAVALIRHGEDLSKTLTTGLEYLGGFREIGSPVLIKPNLCTMKDGTGHSVTDIKVVKAIVDLIFAVENNLSVRIIESDSQSKNAMEAFARFGYTEYCSQMKEVGYDVSTIDLSREPLEKISFKGLYFNDIELPRVLTESNYFISVAVAKTHYLSYITGVLKNLFGVLPRKDMSFYHSRIHDVITDLARIIRPDLNIIDARVGVEDWNGPKTHDIGVFIMGKEPVSVDSVMTSIMGLNPLSVDHLVSSSRYNLGILNPKVIGEVIDTVQVEFSLPVL
ncbi:MAG: DUF362 domain-containing protein [Candidatus Thorarchaeota archaeon]|nr:DUF362 domain-containing protein [Candidatus Thorarchaeota archaeon]